MGEQQKNMLIGVFVLAACATIISIVLFLRPTVGDGKKTLYVRFSNINKITVGTRVTYAGKPVGEVVAVDEIYEAREQPVDSLGRYYFYQLVLKVDSHVQVYNTDEISLQTSGLLGEKSVAIIPKKPPKGVVPKLITDQPVYANSVDPFENTFVQLAELADKADITIDEVTKWIQQNGGTVAEAVRNFSGAMKGAQNTFATIEDERLIHSAKDAFESFSQTTDEVRASINELREKKVFDNISKAAANMSKTSANMSHITTNIAQGKGSLGKFISDDDFYLKINAIMSKADTLMNDVNHYGILFNLNKSWQRLRTKRASMINALDTPSNFKDYFEGEVDQINTAMARISMLIDKAQDSPDRETILRNDLFKQDFAELLRQVGDMADNLRMYNEQLMQAPNACDCP